MTHPPAEKHAADPRSSFVRSLTASLSEHGLLIAGFGVLIVKLLTIAEYSSVTALAIVQSAGLGNTLVGVVLPIFPWLVGIAAVPLSFRRRPLGQALLTGAVLILWLSALLPATWLGWSLLLLVASGPVLATLSDRVVSRGRRIVLFVNGLAVVVCAALVVSVVALDSTMWLPAERLEIEEVTDEGVSIRANVVGYVLESDSDWTSLLTESPRTVIRVRTSEVVGRGPCSASSDELRKSVLRTVVSAFANDSDSVTLPPVCPVP